MRPLYSEFTDELAARCRAGGNRGLWYDKFFDEWVREQARWGVRPPGPNDIGGKRGWIARTRFNLAGPLTQEPALRSIPPEPDRCGDEDLLKETAARIEAFVTARKGVVVEAVTAERFATGTGLPHPIENGFLWHHTLGVPYLPGSGVKGIVLSWDRDWANDGDKKKRQELLGRGPTRRSGGGEDPGEVGAVSFLDALPPEPVALDLDGVTPHDTRYLMDPDGKTPPADWFSPTPIPFLAVARGQKFRFPIVPRSGGDKDLVETAEKWLRRALESLGAGAKTSLDHGRFENVRIIRPSAGDKAEAAVTVGGAASGMSDLADGEQRP
jgi:CRISPR-associated protein Cmr6